MQCDRVSDCSNASKRMRKRARKRERRRTRNVIINQEMRANDRSEAKRSEAAKPKKTEKRQNGICKNYQSPVGGKWSRRRRESRILKHA